MKVYKSYHDTILLGDYMVIKKGISIHKDVDKIIRKKWGELIKSGAKNATYSGALNQIIRECYARKTATLPEDTTTYSVDEGEE